MDIFSASFWSTALDLYAQQADRVKIALVVLPPVFCLLLLRTVLAHRRQLKRDAALHEEALAQMHLDHANETARRAHQRSLLHPDDKRPGDDMPLDDGHLVRPRPALPASVENAFARRTGWATPLDQGPPPPPRSAPPGNSPAGRVTVLLGRRPPPDAP
ncbi:hypothetical protein [Pseudohoeflea coraliihabitans]|uniref:Uncharacterized protein n=1 Tax=Pseudohoeflea coraliihabitans TaxID=2860393 RepID=A0ABS6WS69_9HYPH|nr:hypothetical protein [Pseudohoeflea sp. DP4N28-3]MBW3098812.1 hypothetical protein [Pseudohoeflea sp. DP4N28-3]